MKTQNYVVRETDFTHGLHYRNEVTTNSRLRIGEHLIVSNEGKTITVTIGSKRKGPNQIGLFGFQRAQLGIHPGGNVTIEKTNGLPVGEYVEIGLASHLSRWLNGMDHIAWIKSRLLNLPVAPLEIKKCFAGLGNSIVTAAVSVLETSEGKTVLIGDKTSIRVRFVDKDPAGDQGGFEVPEQGQGPTLTKPFHGVVLRPAVERELVKSVLLPVLNDAGSRRLGIAGAKGVLLYGPPGCGKTQIGRELKGILGVERVIDIRGPELIDKYWGESERKLRAKFEEAEENSPSVVFIDELDAFGGKRSEQTCSFEQTLVTQLLALLDGLDDRKNVVVVAATNRIEKIDLALRRPGRFGKEIYIGPPDEAARLAILRHHTKAMRLLPNVDLKGLVEKTYGFTGADLLSLCQEAHGKSVDRALSAGNMAEDGPLEGLESAIATPPAVSQSDFYDALAAIIPSPLRQYHLGVDRVRMDDIGGLEDVKQMVAHNVVGPWVHRENARLTGVSFPRGIIFYGPPGNGKTMLAKATATAMQWNVIATSGPELIGTYGGHGEQKIRDMFASARDLAPTLIIIDEIDACGGTRNGNSPFGRSIVNQLLYEMQGLRQKSDIMVIGTTNALDLIDPALLRPGRFDYKIMVSLPDRHGRARIFEAKLRVMNRCRNEDWDSVLVKLGSASRGFSGAEIEFVCQEAGRTALKEVAFKTPAAITGRHLRDAIDNFQRNRLSVAADMAPMTL